jgi:hypothetical protein
MGSNSLKLLLALEPDLDPNDWVADFCHQEMEVDVSNYASMSEGLLRDSFGTISFAHETIRVFLATARSLRMDDWCLRSAAAFLALPRTLRTIEEITRDNNRWLQGKVVDHCFSQLVACLKLPDGISWLVPESMTYGEARLCLWERVEETIHLSYILICAHLGWLDHARESISHNGADLKSTDSSGRTMMHLVMTNPIKKPSPRSSELSFCWDHAGLIEALGSNSHTGMSTHDHSGQTALHLLVNHTIWKEYLGMHMPLKDYWKPLFTGSHGTICDKDGLTPLHNAVQRASMITMRMLTRWSRVCINHVSGHGQTPVEWALHSLWGHGQRWLALDDVRKRPSQRGQYGQWWMLRMLCFGMVVVPFFWYRQR